MKIRWLSGVLAVLCFGFFGSSLAGGSTLGQAARAGYDCFDIGDGLGHCINWKSAGGKALTLLVFESMDPDAEKIATEILLHESVYHDQPCPQEERAHWVYLGGLRYYACHHYN